MVLSTESCGCLREICWLGVDVGEEVGWGERRLVAGARWMSFEDLWRYLDGWLWKEIRLN